MRLLPLIAATLFVATACKKEVPPPAAVDASEPSKATDPNAATAEPKAGDPDAKAADPNAGEKPVEPPTGDSKPADPMAGWVAYSGPDGSYKTKFPGKPTENAEDMPIEGLPNQSMKSAIYEGAGGNRVYITAVVEITAPAGTTYDAVGGLKGAVDGMLGGMNATKDSDKDVSWGAAVGKEFVYHGTTEGQNFKGMARVYAVGGAKPSLWQVNALAVGNDTNDEMRQFLDAFELGIPKDGVPPKAEDAKPGDVKADAPPGDAKPMPAIADWVVHESALYKAKFPMKPEESTSPMETAIGTRQMVMATAGDDNGAFMAGAADMQVPPGTDFDAKKAMDGAKEGLLKIAGPDAKTSEEDVESHGLKGKEIHFDAAQKGPDGSTIEGAARIFLDEKGGKRIFTLVAVGKKPLNAEAVKAFFDSFEPK
ncbi:MAG: hypothetical protein U1F43_27915 [Myxococcota bacterium]